MCNLVLSIKAPMKKSRLSYLLMKHFTTAINHHQDLLPEESLYLFSNQLALNTSLL